MWEVCTFMCMCQFRNLFEVPHKYHQAWLSKLYFRKSKICHAFPETRPSHAVTYCGINIKGLHTSTCVRWGYYRNKKKKIPKLQVDFRAVQALFALLVVPCDMWSCHEELQITMRYLIAGSNLSTGLCFKFCALTCQRLCEPMKIRLPAQFSVCSQILNFFCSVPLGLFFLWSWSVIS